MRITTKGRYALRALVNLVDLEDGRTMSIKEISEKENISPEFLEQLFFKMKRNGIIESFRGPGGGFKLNQPADTITVNMVFNAVEEEIQLAPCINCEESKNSSLCENYESCPTYVVWKEASTRLIDYFSHVTLDILPSRIKKEV